MEFVVKDVNPDGGQDFSIKEFDTWEKAKNYLKKHGSNTMYISSVDDLTKKPDDDFRRLRQDHIAA